MHRKGHHTQRPVLTLALTTRQCLVKPLVPPGFALKSMWHRAALSVSTARPYSYRVGVEVGGRARFITSGHLVKCWSMMIFFNEE